MFLSELMNNSQSDEDNIKLIISHYKDYIDQILVNKYYQFKEYRHPRKSQTTEKNKPTKIKCTGSCSAYL